MLKLQLCSDLHLEFEDITITNAGADALILSGDICVVAHLTQNHNGIVRKATQRYTNFFDNVSREFEKVFYVMGNHEYYHGNFDETYRILKLFLSAWPNITLLENEYEDWNGHRFIGTTLWTDMLKEDPIAKMTIKRGLNDYRCISIGSHTLQPEDTIEAHYRALKFIQDSMTYNTIVIGHHAPSRLSLNEKYRHEIYLNGAYYSELFDFIENSGIKLWTHGHMHDTVQYTIGNTLVSCNPRGYRDENKQFNKDLIITV